MSKKGSETKRLIKEQAYKLFAIRGFKDVTMKDICEITGLSRGGCIATMIVQTRSFQR